MLAWRGQQSRQASLRSSSEIKLVRSVYAEIGGKRFVSSLVFRLRRICNHALLMQGRYTSEQKDVSVLAFPPSSLCGSRLSSEGCATREPPGCELIGRTGRRAASSELTRVSVLVLLLSAWRAITHIMSTDSRETQSKRSARRLIGGATTKFTRQATPHLHPDGKSLHLGCLPI